MVDGARIKATIWRYTRGIISPAAGASARIRAVHFRSLDLRSTSNFPADWPRNVQLPAKSISVDRKRHACLLRAGGEPQPPPPHPRATYGLLLNPIEDLGRCNGWGRSERVLRILPANYVTGIFVRGNSRLLYRCIHLTRTSETWSFSDSGCKEAGKCHREESSMFQDNE